MSEGITSAPAAPAATTTNPTSNNLQGGSSHQATTTSLTPPVKAMEPAKPVAADDFWEVPIAGQKIRKSREEVLRDASLVGGAQQRFEEAARMRQEAESVLGKMRNAKDAIKLLQDPKLGLKPEEVRSAFEDWYKEQYIDREAMTPEQRDLADARARIKAYEEKEASEKEKLQQQENQQKDASTAAEIQKEIIEILDGSGLPKTKFTVRQLAHWIRVNESKGLNAPKELLVKQVRQDMQNAMNELVSASDGEVLVQLLGEATVKKLRAHDIARLRKSRQIGQTPQPERVPTDAPPEKITPDEVRRRMRDLKW